jgi:hypothetical protein
MYNQVYQLTTEQKDLIMGKEYAPDCFFYPVQDANDVWVISPEEVAKVTNPEFFFIKDLPLIEYTPKPQPEI